MIQDGDVVDVYLQARRDTEAAERGPNRVPHAGQRLGAEIWKSARPRPLSRAGPPCPPPAALDRYRWQQRMRPD